MTQMRFRATGIVPACLLPFTADEIIDERTYRVHLQDLARIGGVTSIAVNGHASEVHACDFDEQQNITNIALDEVGDRVPVVCGVYAESTKMAVKLARCAERAGAHALLIFPPNVLMFGGDRRPDLAIDYVKAIADASNLPLIIFQFPAWTHLHFQIDGLVHLCESVETIVAIKDLCSDPRLHEHHIRTLHTLTRPVNVMTTHSMWLAGSLAMGARGVISGAGSVIADRQVALLRANQARDRFLLEKLTGDMHGLVEAFYGHPYINWQARMKETLRRFGRFPCSTTRAPLQGIDNKDWARMELLLSAAGLNAESIYGARE